VCSYAQWLWIVVAVMVPSWCLCEGFGCSQQLNVLLTGVPDSFDRLTDTLVIWPLHLAYEVVLVPFEQTINTAFVPPLAHVHTYFSIAQICCSGATASLHESGLLWLDSKVRPLWSLSARESRAGKGYTRSVAPKLFSLICEQKERYVSSDLCVHKNYLFTFLFFPLWYLLLQA